MSKSRMGAPRRVATGLLAGALMIVGVAHAPAAGATDDVTSERLAGATRYGTAAAVSADAAFEGATTAILATGENFPDARYVIGNHEVNVIYVEQIVILVIPFVLGCYCLYTSTRNGNILRLTTVSNKKDKFPLKELEKVADLPGFQQYLKDRLNTRIRINL